MFCHVLMLLFNQTTKNPRLERRNKFVTFTVDLQRDGGPLGLTLATECDASASGSDHRGPIFISALMEDGLAERTKTVQVGDQASYTQTLHSSSVTELLHEIHSQKLHRYAGFTQPRPRLRLGCVTPRPTEF